MKRLEDLKTIADKKLGGLNATPKMLAEIKLAAARQTEQKNKRARLRPVLAVCLAAVLCVGVATWAVDTSVPGPVVGPSVIDSQPAGGVELEEYTEQTNLVEEPTEEPTQEPAMEPTGQPAPSTDLDIQPGSISLGTVAEVPTYHNLFAQGQGGNFPLVMVDGATYRLLSSPAPVSDDLLGEELGQVGEYSLEPALSTGGTVSNAVAQGKTVYAIAGMKSAMVAAPVDGVMRVFQRVSFAGTAVIGSESLADTLCSAGSVTSLELSGVGAISDAGVASGLMQTLLSEASYQSASVSSGGSQSLLIGLSNGLTMQLMVGDDTVSACGTWSCPEFFEAFLSALGK